MRRFLAPASLLLLITVAPARAEDEAAASWLDAYRWSGELSAGYRLVDIAGSKAKYREDYDLRSGGRLLAFSVSGRATDSQASRVDRFSLEVATPHDEPYSRVRARLADDELYDLRISFDRSTYDYAVPRLFRESVADVRRRDDLHDFDLARTRVGVDLSVRPAPWATLLAAYHYYGRNGDQVSTRFVPGADTFLIDEDVDSRTHVGMVGTQLKLWDTHIDLRQEFRHTNRSWKQQGPRPGTAGGLDPTDPATLTTLTGDQDDRIDSPTTRLRVQRTIADRLDLAGGYLYSHASLDIDANRFRTGTVENPVFPSQNSQTASGSADLDVQALDLDGTYRVTDRVRFSGAYRYDLRSQDGSVVRRDDFGLVAAATDYRIAAHRLDWTVEADVRDDLTVRAGARWALRDAVIGPREIDTDTVGALADVRWRPWSVLGFDLRYENVQIDDPWTTPGADVGGFFIPERETTLTFVNRGSAGVRVTPVDWVTVRYRFLADSRENDSFSGRFAAFGHEASLDLAPRDDLSLFLSWSHRDIDGSGDIRIAPLYGTVTSVQEGSEDAFVAQLTWAFALLAQRWSVGSNVSVVAADQELRPAFEPGRSQIAWDLRRIDGGVFVRLHNRWIEPAIEFRMIDYNERVLSDNDYRATMALFSLTKRWSR